MSLKNKPIVSEEIQNMDIEKLIIPDYYCRIEVNGNRDVLKREIQEKGFIGVLIVNNHPKRNNIIIDGILRFEIYKELGFNEIPVLYVNAENIELEQELSIGLNLDVNAFSIEHFGLNYPSVDPKDFGLDGFYEPIEEDNSSSYNLSSGVIKYLKIGLSAEDCKEVYKKLDKYRRQNQLPSRKEALLQIIDQLNLD